MRSCQNSTIWIPCPDFGPQQSENKTYSDLPITPNGFLIKEPKYSTLNECAAYQMANFLGLPVPSFKCFISDKNYRSAGFDIKEGDTCFASEEITWEKKIHEDELSKNNPILTASYLAFLVFDRDHEPPHILSTATGHFFVDLESQFPVYRADGLDRFDEYVIGSNGMYIQRLEQAKELSIVPQFHHEMMRMMEKIDRGFHKLDFGGHPDSSRIEKHFLDSIHQRIQQLQLIY